MPESDIALPSSICRYLFIIFATISSPPPVPEAGLEKGDVITEYDGYHVDLAKDLYVYMYLNNLEEGDTVTMKVKIQ